MQDRRLVVMYSGGLDSLIAYHYGRSQGYQPHCIHLNFGQPYAEKELASILRASEWHPSVDVLNFRELYDLFLSRLTNHIIPSRNVLLAVLGSMFGPRVWINAFDGEQNGEEHDKSERYFHDVSALLTFTNEFFQPQTVVESPFASMSKGEVIRWGLDHGILREVLFDTSSCYSEHHQKCGTCITCVKRYLAFLENDIEEPGYEVNPLKSQYFAELLVEIPQALESGDFARFTEKRAKEFMTMINRLGVPANG